ncbi:MgtC/SapB family protein [Clostridium fallax]|uniref:Putative Mg2+ transporter-C (MgtC) family protein n=1 Tax=Clostridium fallax TaxID=1533 RepID=A0A1M4VW50_9CLOT|nr:MgtC/SapB family protein [Clostridium fallax]SHE73093.1 putative Mg2+ transporter-C (MgtC) family protein [Clostridium fallax]SQB07720.1 transporter protein [Clostridium fallax]
MHDSYWLFLRLIVAGILAGAIGLEREIRSKEAGFRTHFLVGVGSALIMIVSKYGFFDVISYNHIGLDPSRIAAQVISGVGFLGAGTIIIEKKIVRGLTTAAGIWATAGIGITIGSGLYKLAIFSTLLVLVGLELLQRLFKYQLTKILDVNIKLSTNSSLDVLKVLQENKSTVLSYKCDKLKDNDNIHYLIECKLKTKMSNDNSLLLENIQKLPNVLSINIENI